MASRRGESPSKTLRSNFHLRENGAKKSRFVDIRTGRCIRWFATKKISSCKLTIQLYITEVWRLQRATRCSKPLGNEEGILQVFPALAFFSLHKSYNKQWPSKHRFLCYKYKSIDACQLESENRISAYFVACCLPLGVHSSCPFFSSVQSTLCVPFLGYSVCCWL